MAASPSSPATDQRPEASRATGDDSRSALSSPGPIERWTVWLRTTLAAWISADQRPSTGTEPTVGSQEIIPGSQLDDAAVPQPAGAVGSRPLQLISIDQFDPADLMSLDPNQLDHDPVLKALVTGYQQGAARAKGDVGDAVVLPPEWKGRRS